MSRKAVVSLSGGMDSAVLLYHVQALGYEIAAAASYTYGSKHNRYEQRAASTIAAGRGIMLNCYDITHLMTGFKSDLLRTGGDIPEGHYEAQSMSRTVVPGRNMIFISCLAGLAWSLEAEKVFVGIHAGDHAIYPDCRPKFFDAMNQALHYGTDGRVTLGAPFLDATKAAIVKRGLELGVPFEHTRTCYKEQQRACGKCGSCQERLEAFKLNGAEDPIAYETREIMPKVA